MRQKIKVKLKKRTLAALISSLTLYNTSALDAIAEVDRTSKDEVIFIDNGPLVEALLTFSEIYETPVLVPDELVRNKRAPSLSGTFSAEEALKRLIAGTGLEVKSAGNDSFVLMQSKVPEIPRTNNEAAQTDSESWQQSDDVEVILVEGFLAEEYAGGQLARGARLGILGSRDIFDTPFNQQAFTADQINRRQSRNLQDVLATSPAVRAQSFRSAAAQNFTFRGFTNFGSSVQYDGFFGIVAPRRAPLEGIERVEVLLGPSALLTGASPFGNVGGAVNYVPKRAAAEPVTRASLNYISDSNIGGQIDVGRRFGESESFGVRANISARGGELHRDDLKENRFNGTLSFDYTGYDLRINGTVAYYDVVFDNQVPFIGVASGVDIPEAPSNRMRLAFVGDKDDTEHALGTVRIEYNVSDDVSVFAGYAQSSNNYLFLGPNFNLINANGDLSDFNVAQVVFASKDDTITADLGAKYDFTALGANHELILTGSWLETETLTLFDFNGEPLISNLYDPIIADFEDTAMPVRNFLQKTELFSIALADTVSFLGGRVQLTLGVRYQEINIKQFDPITEARTSSAPQNAFTPAVALLVKPTKQLSLYANYIEGLSPGGTAPVTANNRGQILDPLTTEQFEIGAKYDFGTFATTLALFNITRASEFVDPDTNIFGQFGEQLNRGIELSVFGEPVDRIRVIGGFTYVDAELTETGDPTLDGADALGVSNWAMNFEVEADVPQIEGLATFGRLTYSGEAHVGFTGVEIVDSWTRIDLGLNYEFEVQNTQMRADLTVNNIADKAYFIAGGDPGLALSEGRTILFSLTADF
ncbi:MAG: TonB-dependent receptor [Pseudomonadota bacterium]